MQSRLISRTISLVRVVGHSQITKTKARPYFYLQSASFSKVTRGRKVIKRSDNNLAASPLSPVPADPTEAWVEVPDKASGQIYWWNTVTNETTMLGAPRPTGPTALAPLQQQQGGGILSGLGGVMAQGMAFGAGSAVAHNVIGSMFGGGSSHHDSGNVGGDGGDSDGGDSWDI